VAIASLPYDHVEECSVSEGASQCVCLQCETRTNGGWVGVMAHHVLNQLGIQVLLRAGVLLLFPLAAFTPLLSFALLQ